jgi:hypothetical protein
MYLFSFPHTHIIQTFGPTYPRKGGTSGPGPPRKGPRSGPPPGTIAAGGVAIDVARGVDDRGVDDTEVDDTGVDATETLAEEAA